MSFLAGKTPPPRPEGETDEAVNLSLMLKVGAGLGGAGLALAGLLLGIRKIGARDQPPLPVEPGPEAPEPVEKPGVRPQGYVPAAGPPSAHEGADLHIEKVVGVAAILAVVIVLSILTLALLFHLFNHLHPGRTSEAAPLVTAAQIPPRPGVVADPDEELRQVRAQENLHLDHYGWADASHRIARIPIERAMTLWVQTYSAPAPAVPPTTTNSPTPGTTPATTSAPAPETTELQMRQQKATVTPHAP